MSFKKIIFILLLFFAVMAMMSSVSADDLTDTMLNASDDEISIGSSISDITALESKDSSDGDVLKMELEDTYLESSKKGTFTELQKKINNTSKGSTIYLDKDYYYNADFGSSLGIKITKPITIDGKGHSIDGLYDTPLLLINKANDVVVKNIVFKKGLTFNAGCIAVIDSNNVQFKNCQFFDNQATYGGAVFLANCNNPSFTSCIFDENIAEYGGAVLLENCYNPSFSKCDFLNHFSDFEGGAVFMDNCYNPSFSKCDFIGDESNCGGAIFMENSYGCSFSKCNFNCNKANKTSAAIYMENITSSFDSCSFYENVLNDYLELGDDYLNDVFWSAGGAIFSLQSVLQISNTEFSRNGAGMGGGDIYSQYGMIFLEDSTFYDSYAYGFGGSVSFNNDYVQISRCTFYDCDSLSHGGGAIYCLNSILTIDSSDFINCFAYYGGAICSINTELDFKNDEFIGNGAGTIGGTLYTVYGTMDVEGCVFSESYAVRGGAMYITNPQKIKNISNNKFFYCSADRASKIYVDGYYGEIPQGGNVYEDVYFVYANFTGKLNETEYYSSHSNILIYVISNINEYQNELNFYNELRDDFIKEHPFDSTDDHFYIFDESKPDDNIIYLNYDNYVDPIIHYDVDHYNNEYYNLTSGFDAYIFNLRGDELDFLLIRPITDNSMKEMDTNFSNVIFSSNIYDENGWSIYPVSYAGEKNITVLDEKYDNPYYWICQIDPDDFYNYKINGKLSFHFKDRDLWYDYGNVLESKANRYVVSLFNPNYSLDCLPSDLDYYDSRDYGYITPPENQGAGSNCWAFAGIATLEACLKKITWLDYDLSENNAKNLMATSSIYGLNIDSNAGGYDTMFMSYLTSWLGPIGEEYDAYNPTSHISIPFWPIFHIQEIAFISPRKNSWDNDEYKDAIMRYGAVAVTLNWTADKGYNGFHSISLVGWDDNYCNYDSLGNYARGAWIFKNSWGNGWKDGGFGYLSYNQNLSGEIAPYMHSYTFIFNDVSDVGYQDIYQYDFAGVTDYLCSNDSIYYKNRFVARDNDYLYAFSTYFEKPTLFTYSVRINGEDIVKDEEGNEIENIICYSPAGYHTISLGYNLTLHPMDEFEIIIKLIGSGEKLVPVCQADELYKLTYPNNVSFISYNGEDWVDLYELNSTSKFAYGGNKTDTCQVACIKAFTALWRPESLDYYFNYSNGYLDGKGYSIYNIDGNMSLDGKRSITIHCDHLKDYDNRDDFVELNVNDGYEIRYVKMTSGDAYLDMSNWMDGHYKLTAKLRSNFFGSNILYFDVILADRAYAPFSQLQEIINNASEGSAITLDRDYCYDPGLNGDYILINKSITIDGKDHILNGMFKSGIFKINPDCNVTLKNIEFENGHNEDFGALLSYGNLTVIYCWFTNNSADYGGAIYSVGESTIRNSIFLNNTARYYGGSVYSTNTLNITGSKFKSSENSEIVYFTQDNDGADLYLKGNRMYIGSENGATILYDAEKISSNMPLHLVFTNESAIKGDYAHLCQIKDDEGNVFIMGDVNVTLSNENINLNLKLKYNRAFGGYVFDTSKLDYGPYNLTGNLYSGKCSVENGTLHIVKKSVLSASNLIKVYGKGNKLKVSLKDENGKAISNTYISVRLNGKTVNIKTDSNGQASLEVNLAPKVYVAAVAFAGNDEYYKAGKNVKVIIKKITSKIAAKKKTFSVNTKTKKYTITLKSNPGKAIKNAKVTLKVKGKTYKAKTNSKGKATFKITKLNKKGRFTAIIKYSASKYYAKATKKVKITVK